MSVKPEEHRLRIQVNVFWRSVILRNVGILQQHYTASQSGRPRLQSSPP